MSPSIIFWTLLFLFPVNKPVDTLSSSEVAAARYEWIRAIEQGKGRQEEDWKGDGWPNIHVAAVVFNDSLLMIGKNFTWTSSDGIHWTRHGHDGQWGQRYGSAHTVFGGKIWIMGGMKSWDRFSNDIWSSPDGLHWTLVTTKAPWSERRGHAVLVHRGKLWVVGGAESSGQKNALPIHSLADVWSSQDGIAWERVTAEAPWSTKFSLTFFSTSIPAHVFAGKLWMIGAPGRNTVWYSEDGRAWTMATEHASWKERYARGSAVFDSLLWVFGGEDLNDVWASENGKAWKQIAQHAPWSPRAPGTIVVFKNKLWMYGGKSGKSEDPSDDVWYLTVSQ